MSDGQCSLDADLDGLDTADCIAYSSFIESRGQELLDLSLYVSSQNYTTTVRPIYSKLQTFPLPWVTPPAIRSAAKARVTHLGLSALDVDGDGAAEPARSIIPDSLRVPKSTSKSLLKAEDAARIKLDNLANNFFEPLQALRGKKRFFLTPFLTSLDCLALGYLSLALLPDLPSPWLANCMRKRFPQLCAFVHDLQKSFFGGSVGLKDAGIGKMSEESRREMGKGALPWAPSATGGIASIAGIIGTNIADSMPVVSHFRQSARLRAELDKDADEEEEEAVDALASMERRELYATMGSIVAGIGLFAGFLLQQGFLTTGSHTQYEDSEDYAHEDALSLLSRQMELQKATDNEMMRRRNEASLVEVDVEPMDT